jgi:hypothetical protein
MSRYRDDYEDYDPSEFYDYQTEIIEEGIEQLSKEQVRDYYLKYGDCIQERINFCINQSENLHKMIFRGAALTVSATAAEIITRYIILRPLIQGALLSEEWADILVNRITNGRSAEDRELLPKVLRQFGIDITNIKLSNGCNFWDYFLNKVWKQRNDFVHKGEIPSDLETGMAIECTRVFITEIVYPIAKKFDFEIKDNENLPMSVYFYNKDYKQENPFIINHS